MGWVLVEKLSEKKNKLKQVKESKFSYTEYLRLFSLFSLSRKFGFVFFSVCTMLLIFLREYCERDC